MSSKEFAKIMNEESKEIPCDGGLGRDDAKLIDFGLSVLSPRWTSEILIDLATGPKRTTQLIRDLKGVSAKTLCQRLRKLSELGLVSRQTFAEVPPRVEYSLTQSGVELSGILNALKTLGGDLAKNCKSKKRLFNDFEVADELKSMESGQPVAL